MLQTFVIAWGNASLFIETSPCNVKAEGAKAWIRLQFRNSTESVVAIAARARSKKADRTTGDNGWSHAKYNLAENGGCSK